jgi:hypothetical protein
MFVKAGEVPQKWNIVGLMLLVLLVHGKSIHLKCTTAGTMWHVSYRVRELVRTPGISLSTFPLPSGGQLRTTVPRGKIKLMEIAKSIPVPHGRKGRTHGPYPAIELFDERRVILKIRALLADGARVAQLN